MRTTTNRKEPVAHVIHQVAVQHADAEGIEFWFARDLQPHLGYVRRENFQTAINRAMGSCEATGHKAPDHFRGVTKMIGSGKGGKHTLRPLLDCSERPPTQARLIRQSIRRGYEPGIGSAKRSAS